MKDEVANQPLFADLWLPLRNMRSSWGASNDTTILLRSWSDRYDATTKELVLLRPRHEYLDGQGVGRSERERQLRDLRAGGVAGYVVLVNARDTRAQPRGIANSCRDPPRAKLKPPSGGSPVLQHLNGYRARLVVERHSSSRRLASG